MIVEYQTYSEHKRIKSSIIVRNSINSEARYISHKFDTVFFDPPWGDTLAKDFIPEHIQDEMLEEWTEIAVEKVKDSGKILAMNNNGGIYLIRQTLEKRGFFETDRMSIGTCKRNKLDPNIYMSIFKKTRPTIIKNVRYHNIHRSGENNVKEAPRMWLIQALFYYIGKNNIGDVLDMFGGSGNIPDFCNSFNFNCLCVELNVDRYDNILNRLNSKEGECIVSCCRRNVKSIGLCSAHHQRGQNYPDAFLGLNRHFKPIIGKYTRRTEMLIELGVQSITEITNGSTSNSTNGLGGSIQGRPSYDWESSDKISN